MGDAKKILLADDDLTMQQTMSVRLEIEGYEVISAQDGEDAIQKARKEKPALIIMDLMMPKINGYEACQMLKFDEDCKNIPIIVLSALDRQDEKEKALEAGADSYFIKPFDLASLVDKVRQFVSGS